MTQPSYTQTNLDDQDVFWRRPRMADPSRVLLRYMRSGDGVVSLDRRNRKALSRALRIDDYQLILAAFDLEGRAFVTIHDDVIRLVARGRAAA